MSGTLVLVGTPLGNLGDLSPRARDALAAADLILCEDTRHSGRLLRALGIDRPLRSHHAHNEHAEVERVLGDLAAGRTVALISDAGLPLVSDPGLPLVRAALAEGHALAVVPGPSAGLTALVLSGFPPLPHAMFGFLPVRGRAGAAARIADWTDTAVLFLSPHRGAAELAALAKACGEKRPAALARELTKLHEEVRRGTLGELAAAVAAEAPRGEWTLVIGPAPEDDSAGLSIEAAAAAAAQIARDEGLGLKAAAQHVAGQHNLPWRKVYRLLLGGNADD
jgi:16S rRNA (cytidine1402-2'-O)-methyltransferase